MKFPGLAALVSCVLVAAASLSTGCERKQHAPAGGGSAPAAPATPVAPAAPVASAADDEDVAKEMAEIKKSKALTAIAEKLQRAAERSASDAPSAREMKEAMEPMMDIVDKLEKKVDKMSKKRAQQAAKLDQKVADVQALLNAGKYDEAELHIVDIHWVIDPEGEHEQTMVQLYDQKRAALTAFLNRKRPPTEASAAR